MLPDIRSDSCEEGKTDFSPDGILDIHVTEGYLGSPPMP